MSAVVIGATGGIGSAIADAIEARGETVIRLGRRTNPRLDLDDEASIAGAAAAVGPDLKLVIDATGFLHGDGIQPEKSLRQLDGAALARYFAINAIGPALLMKHFLPLLSRRERAVFATLSARVGSISDNGLGGWYGYRASKAALNQFVRTASIELARRAPLGLCVALHPGTVATDLSAPFVGSDPPVLTPSVAAERLLGVIAGLSIESNGGFFDWRGERVPW